MQEALQIKESMLHGKKWLIVNSIGMGVTAHKRKQLAKQISTIFENTLPAECICFAKSSNDAR